jgi:hypothetical protein
VLGSLVISAKAILRFGKSGLGVLGHSIFHFLATCVRKKTSSTCEEEDKSHV